MPPPYQGFWGIRSRRLIGRLPYAENDDSPACYVCRLDDDRDGTISAAEIEADDWMMFLLSNDLDLFYEEPDGNEVYWPHHDLVPDRMSFGFGFRAVPTDVTEP